MDADCGLRDSRLTAFRRNKEHTSPQCEQLPLGDTHLADATTGQVHVAHSKVSQVSDLDYGCELPRSLAFAYLSQRESSDRMGVASEEQQALLSAIVWPFVKGCERLSRMAVAEVCVLRKNLSSIRQKLQEENTAGRPHKDITAPLQDLQQQLSMQQVRHAQELDRAGKRRLREQEVLRAGFEEHILSLEDQISNLKRRLANDEVRTFRICGEIANMTRDLPNERRLSRDRGSPPLRNSTGSPRQGRQSPPMSPPRCISAACPHVATRSSALSSSNPRHGTVVASLDGSTWRSIYLSVSVSGECRYSESISGVSQHLLFVEQVLSVRLGSSKHPQRPLMLSVSFVGVGTRQIDIALSDKAERDAWRQSFRAPRKEPVQNGSASALGAHSQSNVQMSVPRTNADSVASTPSVSSAHPGLASQDNPSLKRWLESQADNVRSGNLDPDGNFSLKQDAEEGRIALPGGSLKREVPGLHVTSTSPVASRPPLGSSAVRDGGATTSNSSRDRLPPLAPQHKRRSTISGSASTADSLTEDDIEQSSRIVLLTTIDDPIAPVSPSHSSDGVASPPSTEDSIHLSPELSPLDGCHRHVYP